MKRGVYLYLVLLALVGQDVQAGEKKKIAVMDLKAETKIEKGTANILNELLLTEVQNTGTFEVLGSSDVLSMLDLEEKKMRLSACTENSCLAEIGGALGVNLMLVASVGGVGDKYLVSVKLLDVAEAKVITRITEMVEREDTLLITAIKRAVAKVCQAGGAEVRPDAQPDVAGGQKAPVGTGSGPVTPVDGVSEEAPSGINWPAWITAGVATFAVGAGIAMGAIAKNDLGKMRDEVKGTDEWQELKSSVEKKSLAADVLFGISGAAAVTSLILFLVLDYDGDDVQAGFQVTPTGGTLTFGLRY